jgi:ubiquinone/menaquinone biosynthesis C-methylase UbiE
LTTGPKKKVSFEKKTLKDFYDHTDEEGRLAAGSGLLELARTREIVERYLPPPPAEIGDVGGGAGIYALWLARKGYRVHLVDPVAKHIEQARLASQKQPGFPLASTAVGDARWLDWEDNSMDFLLFLGPLYHLTGREDRVLALREASRVMRRGGFVLAAIISRYASLLDGFFRGFLDDPAFVPIVENDLADGQHRNPTDNPAYFTDAFFHRPDEIVSEVEDSGMTIEKLLAVESFGGLLSDFEKLWQDDNRRKRLLEFIKAIEDDPSLLGTSAHIIAVVKKPT